MRGLCRSIILMKRINMRVFSTNCTTTFSGHRRKMEERIEKEKGSAAGMMVSRIYG